MTTATAILFGGGIAWGIAMASFYIGLTVGRKMGNFESRERSATPTDILDAETRLHKQFINLFNIMEKEDNK